MRINQNISAMNTYSRLNSANAAKSKSLAKLSSGLRINRAGDDAAGLAISEKMRGQVGGLKQATRNAQDGISMIQTAEGALSETHSILNRMRELAVQSSSDTNTADDRKEIQKEMNQLTSEINRIGNTTEFNTQKVLKGGAEATGKMGSVTSTAATEAGTPSAATGAIGNVSSTPGSAASGSDSAATLTADGLTITAGGNGDAYNGYTLSVSDGTTEAIEVDHTNKTITMTLDITNGASSDISGITATATGTNADDASLTAGTVGFTFSGDASSSASASTSGSTAGGDTEVTAVTGETSFEITTALGAGDTFDVAGQTITVYDTDAALVAASDTGGISLESAADANAQASAIATILGAGSDVSASAVSAIVTVQQTSAGTGDVTGAGTLSGPAGADAQAGSVGFNVTTAFAEGDTLTVGGKTFEFTADGTGAATGNVGLDLSTLTDENAQAGAIRDYFDTGAGSGTFNVTGADANITLTQSVAETGDVTAPTSAGAGGAEFSATLQIGANEGQNFEVKIGDMRASALGLSGAAGAAAGTTGGSASFAAVANTDGLTDLSGTQAEYALDISSNEKASAAITVIDKAIANVSAERSKLGSVQNRLDHTINNLTATSENLSEAESRIRDVDMAEEMMDFTKNNILSQAATSMLAQANQMPQSVLQLLQ